MRGSLALPHDVRRAVLMWPVYSLAYGPDAGRRLLADLAADGWDIDDAVTVASTLVAHNP